MLSFRYHRAARPTALATGFVGVLALSLLVGALPANAQATESPAALGASDISALKAAVETPVPPVVSEAATVAVTDIPGSPRAAVLEPLVTPSVAVDDGVAIVGDSVAALPTPDDNSLSLSNGSNNSTVALSIVGATTTEMSGNAAVTQSVDPGTSVISHVTPEGGIQLLSVTQAATPQVKFAVDTIIPKGSRWETQADGSLHLIDPTLPAAQNILMVAAVPWAVDANGRQLPTHYVVTAGTITQLVDSSTAVFPVVADPTVWWWIGTALICAATIVALAIPVGKALMAITKVAVLVKGSVALTRIITALGGLKKAISTIGIFATNKASLSKTTVALLSALVGAGLKQIADILGIGDCYSLVNAMAK